jgi:hypothetical protein
MPIIGKTRIHAIRITVALELGAKLNAGRSQTPGQNTKTPAIHRSSPKNAPAIAPKNRTSAASNKPAKNVTRNAAHQGLAC